MNRLTTYASHWYESMTLLLPRSLSEASSATGHCHHRAVGVLQICIQLLNQFSYIISVGASLVKSDIVWVNLGIYCYRTVEVGSKEHLENAI